MDAARAVAQYWIEYWAIWHRAFPRLHKRAHWHIVVHLCRHAQGGMALGELFGLIRQLLLLEDATVRDRVTELLAADACTVDPPDRSLTARTIITPTRTLLFHFDATLLASLGALGELAPAFDASLVAAAPARLDDALRATALATIDVGVAHWAALLEAVFTARGLSAARRAEARRNLLSTSHRTLVLASIEHHYGLQDNTDAGGLLADRLAANLLERTGQNFQTTRDHITFLIELGVLERRPGRALMVALAHDMAPLAEAVLTDAGRALAPLAARAAVPGDDTHRLELLPPSGDAKLVVMRDWPFTIGRAADNSLMLPAHDISRHHCRIDLNGSAPVITDLGSTNHTIVDGAILSVATSLTNGAVIKLGTHELRYLAPVPARRPGTDSGITERV